MNEPSFFTFVVSVSSAIGGSLVTLVTFRTRLAMMQRDIDEGKAKYRQLVGDLNHRMGLADERQIMTLRIVVDVANKLGANERIDDKVIQFMAASRSTALIP